MPAVNAFFTDGQLTIQGDARDNTIVVSRDVAGSLLINGGNVNVAGGTPTVGNVTKLQIFGLNGNDTLSLDEANGALPSANIFGGDGNDTLIGGAAADQLFGELGNDTLLGKGGNDQLFGGAGHDVLTGGAGVDQVFGGAGNDRMIWNPGDGSDHNEGGADIDTVEVNGGSGTEAFLATVVNDHILFERVDPAPFAIDIVTSENLVVNMNGGDDSFFANGNIAGLIVDGGTGEDTIIGGDGNDLLIGGDGNDFVDGNKGNDRALLGAGDDFFRWDPGDGSDTVEGQAGRDTMIFNGTDDNENINISANGPRVRFSRDIGNVTMDLNDVERVDVNALGGADTITVNDVSVTDLVEINLDLSPVAGSSAGDAKADTVIVNGSSRKDAMEVLLNAGNPGVDASFGSLTIKGSEAANDQLIVNGGGGNDTIKASALSAGVIGLTLDGGAGNDTLLGSLGADLLIGGTGNDFVDGDRGNDRVLLGSGNDVFQWDPGEGSDTVEGDAGSDRMIFNGADVSEKIDISANGSRVRFFRDFGNITMDLDGVETIDFNALGGADTITVNDQTATDLRQVNLNLNNSAGGGDGEADSVIVNGTEGDDSIRMAAFRHGTSIVVAGLFPLVNITGAEAANDDLTVNALGGIDDVNALFLPAGLIGLTLNGGAGNDLIVGSQGNDLVNGGAGNDRALLGAGDDTFVWNPGDGSDTVEGKSGHDSMIFNGADVDENITISANKERVRFFRDRANVTMDLNDLERIDFNALGGADAIVVNDLSRTDVTEINLDLNAVGDGGDTQPDNVIVNGTEGRDEIVAVGEASRASVLGLSARINVAGAESANDRLTVNTLAGNDVVEASGLAAGAIQHTANGGDGNDTLIGGGGNDLLLGGAGNDVLRGGPGLDDLDGGAGDNIVTQD